MSHLQEHRPVRSECMPGSQTKCVCVCIFCVWRSTACCKYIFLLPVSVGGVGVENVSLNPIRVGTEIRKKLLTPKIINFLYR